MDLYIKPSSKNLYYFFKKRGFKIKKKKNYYEGILRCPGGRFHAMFASLDKEEYCDFHWDSSIHFMVWNVDFKEKPQKYFEEQIKPDLEKHKVVYRTAEVNWFNRRNKSVFSGFRTTKSLFAFLRGE